MLWLKENEPEIYKKSSKWVIIANYIAWKLSGELATDYSLACRTFAFDLNNLEWSNEIIDEFCGRWKNKKKEEIKEKLRIATRDLASFLSQALRPP